MGGVVVLGFELKALQTLKAVVKDRKFKSSLGLKGKKSHSSKGPVIWLSTLKDLAAKPEDLRRHTINVIKINF